MNLERVTFGFFLILALSLNTAFVAGPIDDAVHHNVWLLTIAILVSLIATGLKLGDRSHLGAILLSSSLVADLMLISARVIWIVSEEPGGVALVPGGIETVVSLAIGALVANIVSVLMLAGDTLVSRR